jgi:putative salt-induced outer membrane protein YdiY
MRKFLTIAAVTMLGAGALARADDVILNKGDHLTGTITQVQGGKMTLHSEVLGDVFIPMKDVRTFSTDEPVDLHLTDGTVVNRPVAQSDPGDITFTGGLADGQKVAVANIDTVNYQPFSGQATLGGSLVRGNTFTDTLSAGIKLGYKLNQEELTFTGEYDYGDQKNRTTTTFPATATTPAKTITTSAKTTTTDRWDLYGKYQHFFSKKFYGYADAEVTKDRIASLDLRFTPSAGVGYQWFDTAPLMFGTEGGIAWLYENYTNGTPNREEVSLKLAYHLTYDFNDHVSMFNDLTYYPSIENGKNYLLSSDIGLHAKLTKKLFAELKIEWDYDSNPANNALKNDERYIASLGYTL